MKKPSAASLVLFGFSLGIVTSSSAANNGSVIFPDVPSGAYYDDAVGEMYGAGIITGYQNGRFGPDDYVTRGQVAVMMQRFKDQFIGTSYSSSSHSSRSSTSSSTSSSSSSVTQTTEEGSFRFSTGSFRADENDGDARITVIRYGGNVGAVTVEYATSDGTAVAGTDYEATSGRLTFANGETSKTFTVPINDDGNEETTESITLTLSDASGGAQLGTPDTATLSIVDNDEGSSGGDSVTNTQGVFRFSAREYEVAEDGDNITITVERASGTQGEVSVKFATSNGTATSSYYDQNSGTLTFGDNEKTRTFTVNITDNDDINGNKTVNLQLSNPGGGASLDSVSTASLIIVDDEVSDFGNGEIRFGKDEYEVLESVGSVEVIVDRMKGSDGEVTVEYETTNGTAKEDQDYEETTGTLTFKAGEAQKVIYVPILKDSNNEADESFSVKLSNPTGGAILQTPSTTTITIQ